MQRKGSSALLAMALITSGLMPDMTLGPDPDRTRSRLIPCEAFRAAPPRIPPPDEQERIDAARAKRDRKRAARLAKR